MRSDDTISPLNEETIVAPATGREPGAVAVVRISGASTMAVLHACFRASGSTQPTQSPRRLVRGVARAASGADIDDCLAVWMPAPKSFTGEDVAEIQCHGGPAIIAAILDAAQSAGARLAQPGEFSRRAFLNGKLDLAQAEAVADLVVARTELARRIALRQLRGGLSEAVAQVRDVLIDTAAEIEAHLDFPDDEIEPVVDMRLSLAISRSAGRLHEMEESFRKGRLVREGARVVLAGLPNAGKSSLFNAILGHERAIVTPHPGTTRDTIECTVDIHGLSVTLVDTAGLREAGDEIEQMGIQRTNKAIAGADLVLRVCDASQEADVLTAEAQAHNLMDQTNVPVITVWSKSDLASAAPPQPDAIPVSAHTGVGLGELEQAIRQALMGDADADDITLATERHAHCIHQALASLHRTRDILHLGEVSELVAIDLREAISQLGELLGIEPDEEILDRVFSRFCLGK